MDIDDELREIGQLMHDLPRRRGEAVARARAEGATWISIADRLGMTQHGLIKQQRAYELELTRA